MIVCHKCKKENYIPGTRYCTNCGIKLKKQNKSIPENDLLEMCKSVPFAFSSQTISDNLFYGSEINGCPIFVSHSGKWLWYVRGQSVPIEIEDAPENARNRVIGIIHNDETSPFVLIALRKIVFVYNSFTDTYMTVWVSNSDKQECSRMPAIIKIQNNETDYSYRILLILNDKNDIEKNKLILKSYDLVREKRYTTNEPYKWNISNETIIREYPLKGIKLILDPIYFEQNYFLFIIANFKKTKLNKSQLSGKLLQLDENYKFVKNEDVKLYEKKIQSTIAFYQLNDHDNKIIFWADVDNNPQLWSLSLSLPEKRVSSYMSDNEKNIIDKTSPLCSVLCDGRYCLTYNDHEDRLYVKTSHKSTIPQKVAQLSLENAFIPVSFGNTIFAVDSTKKNILKYTFEKNSLNEKEIIDKSIEKSVTICSNPVHANDRIFFLRDLHSSGKNSLRLECIT
jgi:hypothetical protein